MVSRQVCRVVRGKIAVRLKINQSTPWSVWNGFVKGEHESADLENLPVLRASQVIWDVPGIRLEDVG